MSISSRLAALRANVIAEQAKKAAGNAPVSATLPYWLTPEGMTSLIRPLPDANTENPYPYVIKHQSSLPFQGVAGTDKTEEVIIKVVSPKTHGQDCPITAAIKAEGLWEHEATKPVARQYYPKPVYVGAALAVKLGFTEERVPENPVRIVHYNKSLYDALMAGLMDPEIEELPTDPDRGRDFKIIKTKKGQYANYSTSSFSMKERPLTEAERAGIEKHGLIDLSTLLGKAPDQDELNALVEMYEASRAGLPFDVERWGKWYGSYLKPKAKEDTETVPADATTVPVDHLNTLDIVRSRVTTG
jgi:hypothetical protein